MDRDNTKSDVGGGNAGCGRLVCEYRDGAIPVPATHIVRTTSQHAATDMSAQHRWTERPPTRLRIHPRYNPDEVYPRYNPGPNAVRDCTATYVEEFRPSGTVIVPRMNCFWRRG